MAPLDPWIPLFVYGSLLRGEFNHHYLKGAQFQGSDHLVGFQMFDLGPYPMLIAGQNLDPQLPIPEPIGGERYGIPPSLLLVLDELEEHPEVYRRQWLQLVSGAWAWVYVGTQLGIPAPRVSGGDWRQWRRSKGTDC